MSGPSLPEESKAQEIGDKAETAFQARKPHTWRLKDLSGTGDYGLDYQVQVVVDGKVSYIFRAQLKGTESPELNVTGEYFSLQVKTSTLNYYARLTEPVLLILCDLSENPSQPASCPLYFVWARDEILRLPPAPDSANDPASRTVRFPKANVITPDLDVTPLLENHLRLYATATAFDQAIASALPSTCPDERASILTTLCEQIPRRGRGFIESFSESYTTPWPEAPRESLAGHLNEVHQLLQRGDEVSAKALLQKIEPRLSDAASLEIAEYWYLNGRVHALECDENAAEREYGKARQYEPSNTKYLVAWAETQLRLRSELDREVSLEDVLAELTSDDPEVVALSARLMAASGQYADASAALSRIPRGEALSALAIISFMKSEFDEAIQACTEGLSQDHIPDRKRSLFLLLRGRAKFYQAVNFRPAEADSDFPAAGPSELDAELLKDAWIDIQATVELMRAAGWPTNVQYLADIWASSAIMLGRHEATLPEIQQAAACRPGIADLQKALERVAIQCHSFELALEANQRQPHSADTTFRRVALWYQANRYSNCLELMKAEAERLPRDNESFPFCLSLAILSAERLIRIEAVRDLEALLRRESAWKDYVALVEYIRELNSNLLGRDEAVRRLQEAYRSSPGSRVLDFHLFNALDATKYSEAVSCIEVAEDIRRRARLDLDDTLHLAQAYITVGSWGALLELVDEALIRFEKDGRLVAIKALAVDKLGRTPDAVRLLKEVVEEGARDPVVLRLYSNIVTRSGFAEEAVKLVETLLEDEADTKTQLQYLRLLFGLVYHLDPQSARAENIAWRIGEISDPDDEIEEGLFIITYYTVTLYSSLEVAEGRRRQFEERVKRYTARWPHSTIVRAVQLPPQATPRDVERLIEDVIGESPEQMALRQRRVARLQADAASIPFAWRPRHVLLNVADVPALWLIAKNSKKDAEQYHLSMARADWVPAEPRIFSESTPLLDLVSLLVLHDLNLFDVLFSVLKKVAISQATLHELWKLAHPMTGSIARQQCLDIIEGLKRFFPQILQPADTEIVEGEREEEGGTADIERILSKSQYVLYSDDSVFRALQSDSAPTVCTLDLLRTAEHRGLLSAQEVAERIGRLVLWNVGLRIETRYLMAVIPDSVVAAGSVSDAVDALRADELAEAVFEAIWNVRLPYNVTLAQISEFLCTLVQDARNRTDTIAAVWGLWYLKAKLRSDVEITPLAHLGLSLGMAAHKVEPQDVNSIGRLWKTFVSIIPLEYGTRMDEQKEREAIARVGKTIAEMDRAFEKHESLCSPGPILMSGIAEGTAERSWFSDAYTSRLIELSK